MIKNILTGFMQLFIIALMGTGHAGAQLPGPQISNTANIIAVPLSAGQGTVWLCNQPFKQNWISWAFQPTGTNDFENLTWQSIPAPSPDSSYFGVAGFALRAGDDNAGQFYIYYQDGRVTLCTATGNGITGPVYLGGSVGAPEKMREGTAALYMLNSAVGLNVSRDSGATWQVDMGIIGDVGFEDFDIDTFHNLYAADLTNVYKQQANSDNWYRFTSFPANADPYSVFVDQHNRIFIGTWWKGVYCSKDTGNTWTRSITPLTSVQCGQFCEDNSGNIYMIGEAGRQLFRSTDTGDTWTEIDAPVTSQELDSTQLYIINGIAADSVLTAATIYGTFYSVNQGNTWTAFRQGMQETKLNGFYKSPSGRYIENSNNGSFYLDPTATAFVQSLPHAGFGYNGPVYADTLGNIYTRGYALPGYGTDMIWKSNDYGSTWQTDSLGLAQVSGGACFGVDEYGNEHLNASGPFGVTELYSKVPGGGFSLDIQGISNQLDPYFSVNSIVSDGAGNLFMAGGGNASPLTCWRRPVTGGTWVLDTAGLPDRAVVEALTHDNMHQMLAWVDYGGIYYRDTGVWTVMPLPVGISSGSISAFAADNSGGILVAFSGLTQALVNTPGVYCTHNHGLSWNSVGLEGINVYGLNNFGDTTFALTDIGVFAITCNGVASAIAPVAISEPAFLNLFPNPASGLCNAEFTNLSSQGKIELVIMDISGRRIKTIAVINGAKSISFPTDDMNPGIYLCVQNCDGKVTEVRKLIVAR